MRRPVRSNVTQYTEDKCPRILLCIFMCWYTAVGTSCLRRYEPFSRRPWLVSTERQERNLHISESKSDHINASFILTTSMFILKKINWIICTVPYCFKPGKVFWIFYLKYTRVFLLTNVRWAPIDNWWLWWSPTVKCSQCRALPHNIFATWKRRKCHILHIA